MNQQQNVVSTNSLQSFFGKVYGYLGLGIGISAIASYLIMSIFPKVMYTLIANPLLFILMWVAELGLVVYLSSKAMENPSLAFGGFMVYSILNGVMLSVTLTGYSIGNITAAFASAAVTYGVMAVFGTVTKKNLSGIGHAAISALVGVIIASLLNVFLLKSSPVDFLISLLMVVIFAGLTAYDHQKIKQYYLEFGNSEKASGIAVFCALQLYLDFINLFLAFLRIFGNKN